ncbi:AAA family ATPase [Flavobacterium sp. MEB061]|uniref:AAA family ATPase n=1 Tax=Flavobacterium sp. MEB061 TaxID=1587524 RepID=UPI000697465A|nr:AAA family ATPase [Flavobacterium sp. MEB061]
MERAKLIVKNFGPLKDIEIEVREMVTFIGAQASGKSTLAKLIAILEDKDFRSKDEILFEDELKKYNIFSNLKEDTIITYTNVGSKKNPFEFTYLNNESFKNNIQNHIISYKKLKAERIESEKLFNTVKNKISEKDIIFQKYNELQDIVIKTENDFKKLITVHLNLHLLLHDKELMNFFKDKEQLIKFKTFLRNKNKNEELSIQQIEVIFEILKKNNSTESYIELFEDIISLFPNFYLFDSVYIPTERNFLHIIHTNILGLLNNNIQIPKYLLNSGQEYEKAINTIKELPLNIIDKKLKYKREGQTSYIYHNKTEKIDLLESASGLQSIIPILLLVEYSKSLKEEYNFNFVVEEPELNLYPKAQHELIKYLVKNCLVDRKNLIVTTHSPFVLASINNLLLAYDKGQKKPKEVNKIVKKESWLNPKNFIAYELKNGKAKLIMDDKLGQIADNMIDSVSDTFADEFDKLLDL